jgi:hypothetical protein
MKDYKKKKNNENMVPATYLIRPLSWNKNKNMQIFGQKSVTEHRFKNMASAECVKTSFCQLNF